VDRGQREAALALGLRGRQVLRRVVLPQALRVIVPPLTSQYLNLTKNSSLAIAIAFPDLFSVGQTIGNQTGQFVIVTALIMAFYLAISLLTSLAMGLYGRRIRLVER
jgi:general L-amino acid transport system permease protein